MESLVKKVWIPKRLVVQEQTNPRAFAFHGSYIGVETHAHTHYTDKLGDEEAQEHTMQNVLPMCKVQR